MLDMAMRVLVGCKRVIDYAVKVGFISRIYIDYTRVRTSSTRRIRRVYHRHSHDTHTSHTLFNS